MEHSQKSDRNLLAASLEPLNSQGPGPLGYYKKTKLLVTGSWAQAIRVYTAWHVPHKHKTTVPHPQADSVA